MEWADKSGKAKMQRGSSVNFQPIKLASHAVSHAARGVQPEYLLPPDKSLGTIIFIDDHGKVASTLEAKLALASRQAKRQGDYSPLWEGVINLRSPKPGEDEKKYKNACSTVIAIWCDEYTKLTGHKVLRADIHLDEGRLDKETGEILFNAHAHVMCDKTNDLGRVLKVNAPTLRKIQDFTSEITGLKRGENSLKTGLKHISHQQYKALAEKGKLETQQQIGDLKATHGKELDKEKVKTARIQKLFQEDTPIISNLKSELAQLKAQYDQDRATLKASGEATQQAYQALKKSHEQAQAELKATREKMVKMDEYSKKLEADLVAGEAKIAQVLIEKAEVIEGLVRAGEKSDALLKTAIGHRDAAAKLTGELAEVKAEFSVMAEAYQAEKAKGTSAPIPPEPAIEPPKAAQPPLAPPRSEKAAREAFLAVWAGIKMATLNMIDGARLDAADGRLGLFSWLNRATGGRNQVLCEVPFNKVMPKIGELFDSRAVPGKEKSGVGR